MTARTKQELYDRFSSGGSATHNISQIEQEFEDLIDSIGSIGTITVAASDASDASKGRADYQCDGTADNVQIQAAIAALPTGGGKVVLSEGTFTLASTIQPGDDTTIMGVGTATIITIADSSDIHGFQNEDTTDGNARIMLANFLYDGNKANQSGTVFMTYFQRATDVTIRDVEVQNCNSDGIHIRINSHRCIVENVRSHGNEENGVMFTQSDYCVVNNLIAYSNGGNGLMVGHADDSVLNDFQGTNIISYSNTQNGVFVANAKNVKIQGEAYDNGYSGLTISDAWEIVLDFNSHENDMNGLGIFEVDGFIIRGMYKDNNQGPGTDWTLQNGIAIYDATNASQNGQLIGCDTSDDQETPSQLDGIYIEADASSIRVIGGRSENNTGEQIDNDSSTDISIRDVIGFTNENSGTATIASGDTTEAVAHGLAATPTVINIAFREQGTSDFGRWWVDTIGAANFTLNVSADPGASNLDFAWEAKVR